MPANFTIFSSDRLSKNWEIAEPALLRTDVAAEDEAAVADEALEEAAGAAAGASTAGCGA